MCRTDPSDTVIKYPSLSCALSISSIVLSILPYLLASGTKVTNLVRSLIHFGCSTNSCLNDSTGPIGTSLSIVVVSSSALSSLYIFSPAVMWIQTGVLHFVD